MDSHSRKGILFAIAAAALFGGCMPFAKLLLASVDPWMLAGLLYLGSGLGLSLLRLIRPRAEVRLGAGDWPWLMGAILSGGVAGPVLLMLGLSGAGAATSSLLLNAEGVFTALLAWMAFRENVDRRILLGMAAILAGAIELSWTGGAVEVSWPALAILGACFCWGIDNNLTRKVSLSDPFQIAAWKGLAAGLTNVLLALLLGAKLPGWSLLAQSAGLGFLGYGLSLAAFVLALRWLGTARTGAYFSTAPFVGALLSVPVLGEALDARLLSAGALMAVGVVLHLMERHEHDHIHGEMDHEHAHAHDAHHSHDHPEGEAAGEHVHRHSHSPLRHRHSHYPDAHHRHRHG